VNSGDRSLAGIRLVAFDIDGVFTDGRLYISNDGIESKAFHTHDGFGIRQLIAAGLHVAVISGRESIAVEKRMSELGVHHVIQGNSDKVAAFDALTAELGISEADAVYVGDDIPDLPLLNRVGFSVAVSNAHEEVKAVTDYTTDRAGGFGAVREVCDLILNARNVAGA
jgi:3-deoxy-D-manno-octulosonate 8-phosphate phosphatase (KDO 8-P phosphatase)